MSVYTTHTQTNCNGTSPNLGKHMMFQSLWSGMNFWIRGKYMNISFRWENLRIWWFPKIGVPLNHPSWEKKTSTINHPKCGSPMAIETRSTGPGPEALSADHRRYSDLSAPQRRRTSKNTVDKNGTLVALNKHQWNCNDICFFLNSLNIS